MAKQENLKRIQKLAKCSVQDVLELEALMWIGNSMLDELKPRQFNSLLATGKAALKKLRKEDPGWTLGPF